MPEYNLTLVGRVAVITLALFSLTWMTTRVEAQAVPTPPKPTEQVGRYVIVQVGQSPAYMLDSSTGRVWQPTQLTQSVDSPVAWRLMDRSDSHEQFEQLVAARKAEEQERARKAASSKAPLDEAARRKRLRELGVEPWEPPAKAK